MTFLAFSAMRPELITQIVLKQFFCITWAAANGGVTNGGLKGCLAALPGNRPKSAVFALFFCLFLPFSRGCETDVRAIGKLIPREFLCAISAHRKYHVEAPELPEAIPASKPCVTDVCSWEIKSPFLTRQKKDFPFFPVGRPRPELSPKPRPCRLPFRYQKD